MRLHRLPDATRTAERYLEPADYAFLAYTVCSQEKGLEQSALSQNCALLAALSVVVVHYASKPFLKSEACIGGHALRLLSRLSEAPLSS